ncbi:hypothetical protein [Roseibium sp. M-1]
MKLLLLNAFLGTLVTAVLATSVIAQEPEIAHLQCAAGYGCQDTGSSQCEMLDLLGLANGGQARDRFAEVYPAEFVEAARASTRPPVECLRAAAGSGGANDVASPEGNGGTPLPEFAGLDGYAEAPCPGKLAVDPIFVQGAPDIRVLACFKGADNLYQECGAAPARAYCLKFGNPDVACFGDIKPAAKAANIDAYCETGECPAFGFIVCK